MQGFARNSRSVKLLVTPMLLILTLLALDATRSPTYAQLSPSQVLVTDRPSGMCHIVDPTIGEVVTTFDCGTGAQGVDVNSSGTRAVIGSCLAEAALRLFDLTTSTPTLLGTIPAGVNCVEELDIAPNDQFGIAPGSIDGRVSKFTLSPFAVTGTSAPLRSGVSRGGSPQDVHVDRTNAEAVFPLFDTSSLPILDVTGSTPAEVAAIPTGETHHHGITLSEGDNDTILAGRLAGGITIASRTGRSLTATILTTVSVEALDVTCDGRRAVAETSGGLAWIDMTTSPPTVLSTDFGEARSDGVSTSSVAFSRDGSRLFVGGGDRIDIYDVTSDPPTLFLSFTATPNFNLATLPCSGEAPVAHNDDYSVNEDVALSIASALGVLANDTGGSLTAELVAPAEHGSVTLNADGSFTYVPNPNFNGPDSFLYVAKKGTTESNIATVMITVGAVNDPPFFNLIPAQFVPPVNENQTVDITGLSPGPANESLQTLVLTAISSNTALISNLAFSEDGSTLTYQRVSSSSGTATITVTAQDNGGTANGGADTFSRTFDITVGTTVATSVEASLTGFSPNSDNTKAPTVEVTVTVRPIDFDGNGVIDVPGDCFRFFRPRPAPGQPYNVIPSNANQIPEGPPWRIPEDTIEVCDVAQTFTGVLDLSEWITTGGTHTTDIFYVSIVRDPELSPDGQCPAGAACFDRIWTGIRPVGSLTFTAGDGATVADVNKVTLHTTDTALKTTSDAPLEGVVAHVYDRNDGDFQNQEFDGKRVGKNPDGSLYDDIFESTVGRISTCTTSESGVCIATEAQAGEYLVIVKFIDRTQHLAVYTGLPKGSKDFVNGVATKSFTIVKKLNNGSFQEYQAGSKTVVKACTPTICP